MPTLRALHEYRQQDLDPTTDVDRTASHVGIGSDGSDKSVSDDDLGDEILITSLAEVDRDSETLTVRAFIDSTQANGETIREVSLETDGDGDDIALAAESLPDPDEIAKDSATTVTVDVELSTSDESEVGA